MHVSQFALLVLHVAAAVLDVVVPPPSWSEIYKGAKIAHTTRIAQTYETMPKKFIDRRAAVLRGLWVWILLILYCKGNMPGIALKIFVGR